MNIGRWLGGFPYSVQARLSFAHWSTCSPAARGLHRTLLASTIILTGSSTWRSYFASDCLFSFEKITIAKQAFKEMHAECQKDILRKELKEIDAVCQKKYFKETQRNACRVSDSVCTYQGSAAPITLSAVNTYLNLFLFPVKLLRTFFDVLFMQMS